MEQGEKKGRKDAQRERKKNIVRSSFFQSSLVFLELGRTDHFHGSRDLSNVAGGIDSVKN